MDMVRVLRVAVVCCLLAAAVAAVATWALGHARQAGLVGTAVVPTEYRAIVREAARRCPQVPVEVLAAQIHAESGYDPTAQSSAGAQGIAQFMPAVWKQYGLDANGDGTADVWDPYDAIHSAAALNCVNRKLVKRASGPRLANTLAAYNAGFSAVLQHDGVPPYAETKAYVEKILRNATSIEY